MKYIDVTRTTHTKLYVLQESRIDDHWNVDVDRNSADSWTVFPKFTLSEKPPKGRMWSGERCTKIQATTRPDCGLKFCPACHRQLRKGEAGMGY